MYEPQEGLRVGEKFKGDRMIIDNALCGRSSTDVLKLRSISISVPRTNEESRLWNQSWKEAVQEWIKAQPITHYSVGIMRLVDRWTKYIKNLSD